MHLFDAFDARESDTVAPSDRFGAWLNRVSSGSAIVTAPTANACAELDCSPAVLERAIASHHGIAATFQMQSVCLEMLPASEGKVALTPAQLAMLLEGIDWRMPQRTWRPMSAG